MDAIKWTRVRAIIPAGRGFFYDMHVPGAANYAANGIFNHNCGKTMTGSNWILEQALKYPQTRWAVVAPTFQQVQDVCFAPVDSGIRAQALPGEITDYNKNNMLLTLHNGSEIKGFSAENPERIRGYNLAGAWLDEAGSYRYRSVWDEVLEPALRKGNPRVLVTTTPSASPLLKEWYTRFIESSRRNIPCDIHLTTASFKENDTLPPKRVEALERQYGGTRVGRQELEGEMLEDFEGALWKREFIEASRVRESDFYVDGKLDAAKFTRIVVAVDPSMTAGERSDESGIVVAGQGADGDGYLIADWSCHGSPEEVMRRAVAAYYEFYADCVVMEVNQGGDYLTKALQAVDSSVVPRTVRALKGKMIRAQPISMLAEQGKLHHIGYFPKLEDQLCVAAGTMVSVRGGVVPVEDVSAGMEVYTRDGFRRVAAAGCTGVRETVVVETGVGELSCTGDHPVYVRGRGWVEAALLRPGDILLSCLSRSSVLTLNSRARNTSWITPAITGPAVHAGGNFSTGKYGQMPMVSSRLDSIFTTRIMTGETISLKTLSRSLRASTFGHMESGGRGRCGENLKLSWHGTSGKNGKLSGRFPAESCALNADSKSSLTAPTLLSTVVESVRNGQSTAVYDVEVEDTHEFFANGILVHNCVMTPERDKNAHDDRADAFVWAFSELRGITEGSFMDAYGYRYCNSCGNAFRKVHVKCPSCGFVNGEDNTPVVAGGKWANAYLSTCKECGRPYNVREKKCPSCHPDAEKYMSMALRAANKEQGWLRVPERNWFQGRRGQ